MGFQPTEKRLAWFDEALSWAQMAASLSKTKNGEPDQDVQTLVSALRIYRDVIRTDKPTVAFMGQFSSGKTSVLNGLIGAQDLLPTNLDETTAINTLVEYSQGKRRNLQFPIDGGWSDVDENVAEQFFTMTPNDTVESPLLAHFIKSGQKVRVQTDQLRQALRGYRFLDTPGLSSATLPQWSESIGKSNAHLLKAMHHYIDTLEQKGDEEQWQAKREMDRAHAQRTRVLLSHLPMSLETDLIIWVTDIQQGLEQQDLALLEQIQFIDVLVLLNKADTLSPSQRREQVEATKKLLAQRDVQVVAVEPYSARDRSLGPNLADLIARNLGDWLQGWVNNFTILFDRVAGLFLEDNSELSPSQEAQDEAEAILASLDLKGFAKRSLNRLKRAIDLDPDVDWTEAWKRVDADLERMEAGVLDLPFDAPMLIHPVLGATYKFIVGVALSAMELAGLGQSHMIVSDFTEEVRSADFWHEVTDGSFNQTLTIGLPRELDADVKLTSALKQKMFSLWESAQRLGLLADN